MNAIVFLSVGGLGTKKPTVAGRVGRAGCVEIRSGFHFFSFDGDSGVGPKAPKYCVCFLHPFYTPPEKWDHIGTF